MIALLCLVLYAGIVFLAVRAVKKARIPWTRKRLVVGTPARVGGILLLGVPAAVLIYPLVCAFYGTWSLPRNVERTVGQVVALLFWGCLIAGLIVCGVGKKVSREEIAEKGKEDEKKGEDN